MGGENGAPEGGADQMQLQTLFLLKRRGGDNP